jgi:glyoxylase-like metal-dependent hydrolase (beta-lactamase superfamily II)
MLVALMVAGLVAAAVPATVVGEDPLPPSSPPYVIQVNDHVVGFYVGRGLTGPSGLEELYPENWVNYGAWDLGGINYVVYRGDRAIVYDTGTLPSIGWWERDYLEKELGIKHFTVVLSHWHLDHIAGLEAFADSPIYANAATYAYMRSNRKAIEAGTLWGPPAVPVIMPTKVIGLKKTLKLAVGDIKVEFRNYNIHSRDGWAMIIPSDRALYPGDMLEDTVTYMVDPGWVPTHVKELARLRKLCVSRIYPNHGDPAVIMAGGYTKSFIDAMVEYDTNMLRHVHDAGYLDMSIEQAIPNALAAGAVSIWEPYRAVQQMNLALMRDYWANRTLPKAYR